MKLRVAALLLVIVLAGCLGLGGADADDETTSQRIVVENGYLSAQNVTVAVETPDGVINETRRVPPGERWNVTTVSGERGEYSVTVSTARRGRIVSSSGNLSNEGDGTTLYVVGDGVVATCGGGVTCQPMRD